MLKSFIHTALSAPLALGAVSAHAAYDTNNTTHIIDISAYNDNYFIVTTDSIPTVAGCTANKMIVKASSEEALSRLFARAQTAQANYEAVSIGYDSTSAACTYNGFMLVYKIG